MKDRGAKPAQTPGSRHLVRSTALITAVVLAMVAALALVLVLRDALLVVFAAVLLALPLHAASAWLHQRLPGSRRLALGVVVATIVAAVLGSAWAAGGLIAEQLERLGQTLPEALAALRAWLDSTPLGQWALRLWRSVQSAPQDMSQLAAFASGAVNAGVQALGAATLVAVLAVYLAADPRLYHAGLLRLVPQGARVRTDHTLRVCGQQLTRWLMGQGLTMVVVAVMTAAGLAAIGMPLALTLGLIAGVLEFVPYVGTLVSSVLIVTVSFTGGESMALHAAIVCSAVQLAEAYVVMPLSQRWAVRMPPALALLAVLVFSLLLGLPGLLLAVPLMVLLMALVQQLLLPDTLPQAVPHS